MVSNNYDESGSIIKPKESLEIQDIEVPNPKGSQVLVKDPVFWCMS